MADIEKLEEYTSHNINKPIDINSVDKSEILFYLADNNPMSLSDFAEDCESNNISSVLENRFGAEIDIDMFEYIQLTQSARRPVIRASEPYLISGKKLLKHGKSLAGEEKFKRSVKYFNKSISIFALVNRCFSEVQYDSNKVNKLLEISKRYHDNATKEVAKELIHENINQAQQHESKGDDLAECNPSKALDEYQIAIDELSKAIDLAKEYNTRLQHSKTDLLSIQSLQNKSNLIKSKSQKVKNQYSKFETTSNTENNTRKAMLQTVRDLHDTLGRIPKTTELPEQCDFSPNDFYQEFGSWNEALEAAGLDKEASMLDEIERVAEKLGRVPNTDDMSEHGAYSSYSSYFGSWSTAVEKSGVEKRFGKDPKKKREDMVEILQSLHHRLGRVPKANELPEECGYSRYDFRTEFGSWDGALEAAGINKEQALLDDIERVAEIVGHVPRSADMDEHGIYSYSYYLSYFDSWSSALEKSGIKKNFGQDSETKRKELLEILQSLHRRLGRVPKANELPEECEYVPHNFYNEFGTWDEALEAAGINKEQAMLDDVERVAEKVERIPSTVDMQKYGTYSSYSPYFGSWSEAIEAVDLSSVDTDAASEQTSNHASGASFSSSTRGASSYQLQPNALNNSWETIPRNERIDGQFLIQVINVDQEVGDRKIVRLDIQDQNGREFGMNLWSKHNIDWDWREGKWYALENTRGKVWESSDGTTRKQLNSTKDLNIVGLGSDFDPNAASAEETSETASEPEQSGATTDEGVSGSTPDSTTSDQDTATTVDDGESSEDGSQEGNDDGLLGDIMSEFDGI